MFVVNEDMSIYLTRGDIAFFTVTADNNGVNHKFQPGDVVRIKVTEKKACENVMFQKDFLVTEEAEKVDILLTEEETKIGEVISKPTDYWYEIELNPYTNPQTIVGYDEDGAKILKLFPEGRDLTSTIKEEDIPVVDEELDLTSERPVQNQAVTRALFGLEKTCEHLHGIIEKEVEEWFDDDTGRIKEVVKEWLDEHPEATTAVQDHSLTIDKMVVGTFGTPVNVLALGVDNTGETDISDIVNTYTKQFPLYFPVGKYKVSKPIYLYYPIVGAIHTYEKKGRGNYNGATVFCCDLNGSSSNAVLNINDDSLCDSISNIVIYMGQDGTGIKVTPSSFIHVNIENVTVLEVCNGYGFYINPKVSISKACYMSNIYVGATNSTAESLGIFISEKALDCRLINYSAMYVYKGLVSRGGILQASNIHIWTSKSESLNEAWWKEAFAIKAEAEMFITNLYLDSSYYPVRIYDDDIHITNLFVYYDDETTDLEFGDGNGVLIYGLGKGKAYIDGGTIHCKGKLKNIFNSYIGSISNVKVLHDYELTEDNEQAFPQYPNVKEADYNISGIDSTTFHEIASVRIGYYGFSSLFIGDPEGNTVLLEISRSNKPFIRKTTLSGSLELYYLDANGYRKIFVTGTNSVKVTYQHCSGGCRGVIYSKLRTSSNNNYPLESYSDATGLTEINEKN